MANWDAKDIAIDHPHWKRKMSEPCKFCGVLPEYGHFDWCKVDRAPTGEEIAMAVIDEEQRSVGYDGPSAKLVGMCEAFLTTLNRGGVK